MPDHRPPSPPRLHHVLAVALAATAVAAPAASARVSPEEISDIRSPHPVALTDTRYAVPATAPVVTRTVADDGVDWGSVALGAGGAVALVLLTAGSGSAVARHRHRVGPVA
jgi:hypothetical protein